MAELPTHAAFVSQLNNTFEVQYDPEKPPEILTLKHISEISSIGGGFAGYGMTFVAPLAEGYLMQKQWPMKNDTLGEFSLFLVPGGPKEDSFEYNATLTFKQS
jgi:hypothetical protein